MRVLCLFLGAMLVFSQTKISLPTQASGSPIHPNGYFSTITSADGKVSLLPGPYWSYLNGNSFVAPPNSQARCAEKMQTGIEKPAYEYVPIGKYFEKAGYLYICSSTKTWRRVRTEEF